jgi:membrane-associated phospholipid phosphatase
VTAVTANPVQRLAGGFARLWWLPPVGCGNGLKDGAAPAQAAAAVAAAGVGASRVCLGVHWPADVVAGWLFAIGWLHLTGPDHRAR